MKKSLKMKVMAPIFGGFLLVLAVIVILSINITSKEIGKIAENKGKALSKIIAVAVFESLDLEDSDSCLNNLKTVRNDPSVVLAQVYKTDLSIFAQDYNETRKDIQSKNNNINPKTQKEIDDIIKNKFTFSSSVLKDLSKSNSIKITKTKVEGENCFVFSSIIINADSKETVGYINIVLSLKEVEETVGKISFWQILISIIAFIFIGFVSFVILSRIFKPLLKGVKFSQQIAEGDLTAELDVDQKDEIGDLGNAMKMMSDNLKQIVYEVQTAAENVASGSEELSVSAQSLSVGSTEQASATEEISSSMEEMSANIQKNTDNAQQTEKISAKASSNAKDSGEAVTGATTAMKEITEKINIIQEIARQTNLLALNAAIEAARAGEHGKGFAVVASEVRKLAERSHNAAEEITELAKNSLGVAEKAVEMLDVLVPDIGKTADLVSEITASSTEQNQGAGQIVKAINDLDKVVQSNAGASEEMASTAEELSSQAQQLQSSISFFKIDNRIRNQTQVAKQEPVQTRQVTRQVPAQTKPIAPKTDGGMKLDLGGGVDNEDQDFERF